MSVTHWQPILGTVPLRRREMLSGNHASGTEVFGFL